MISIISMHARALCACNIDLTMVYIYVEKVQCTPPPFFFLDHNSFLEKTEKISTQYVIQCNKIETLLIFIEIAFIVTTWNHYKISRATPFGPPVAPASGASIG